MASTTTWSSDYSTIIIDNSNDDDDDDDDDNNNNNNTATAATTTTTTTTAAAAAAATTTTTTNNNNNNNNNYNDNDNNNCIQRRSLRLNTISSLRLKLSPTRTLKWPRHNRVKITCNTSSGCHVQRVVRHLVRRDSSAIKFDRVEIAFISALLYWLKPLTDEVVIIMLAIMIVTMTPNGTLRHICTCLSVLLASQPPSTH